MLGGKPPIFGQGRGPNPEAQRTESGGGVLGEKAVSPLPSSYGVRGSAVISPSDVRDKSPAAKRFSCILEAPDCLSWNLLRARFGA